MGTYLRIAFLLGFLLMGLAGIGVYGVYLYFSPSFPSLNSLSDYRPSLVTRVFARDYQLLGEFYLENRQLVTLEEVPKHLIDAFLAIEDTAFYKHYGINPVGIMRAALANLKAGRLVQGASTITQQVAKTFFLSSERSFRRKAMEIMLAFRIESNLTKDEILSLYINQIYLGAGAYGVGAASRIYFNKNVSDITLGEAAMLASLPKAPSKFNPWRNPEVAKQRKQLVLNRMLEVGFLTPEEFKQSMEEELVLGRPEVPLEPVAPYFLEHVRRTIQSEWGTNQLYRGGLDIYTTLDPEMQRAAHFAVRQGLVEFDRRNGYRGVLRQVDVKGRTNWLAEHKKTGGKVGDYLKALVLSVDKQAKILLPNGEEKVLSLAGVKWARPKLAGGKLGLVINRVADAVKPGDEILVELPTNPEQKDAEIKLAQEPDAEAALIAMDPHTGQILSMVGGYDFQRSEFNRAIQAVRQPGSSFKPFIYAAALNKGFKPNTLVDDSPIAIPYKEGGVTKLWRPHNYEQKFYGPTTVRVALEHSRNLVTIRLLQSVGVPELANFVRPFGLNIPPERQNLALSLGTIDFTPLEMTTAYSVFANGGKLVQPIFIARVQDKLGRTIHRHSGGDCLLCHVEPGKAMGEEESQKMTIYGARILEPETAYQTVNMMKGVVERGTAGKARQLGRPLAGKTGTTNDFRDAWFIGFSPSLVAAVWVGRDDYQPLGIKETGGRVSLPIWMSFMKKALENQPITDFPVPSGIYLEEVDAATGLPPGPDTREVIMEAFRKNPIPFAEEDKFDSHIMPDAPSREEGTILDQGLY
ncbi:MAG: PBP1A family penicillin-binding protein [Magnetococcales bacterium]|nr:PBP1A family penicillin-binding protein [Magnetococcales bacterium]NGZ25877.1 PBP1A family penicillin-binding protein [Magnetococcales bacterium]